MHEGLPNRKGTPGGLSRPSQVGGLAMQQFQVPARRRFVHPWERALAAGTVPGLWPQPRDSRLSP